MIRFIRILSPKKTIELTIDWYKGFHEKDKKKEYKCSYRKANFELL